MSTNLNIFDRVVSVIIKNYKIPLNKDQINEDTDVLIDLGFESIKILEMIVYLEEEFIIEFDDESLVIDKLKTVGMIVRTIKVLIERGIINDS